MFSATASHCKLPAFAFHHVEEKKTDLSHMWKEEEPIKEIGKLSGSVY